MFISSTEKQHINHMIDQLSKGMASQASINSQQFATLSAQIDTLNKAINHLQIKAVKQPIVNPTMNDKEIEILRNKNVALAEDKKSLSRKLDALQERYEAETGKPLITRNRVSKRKKDALTAIDEIKAVKVEPQQQVIQ
jgi:hypothetical protein